jgi:hypothetical protein
MSRPTCQSLFCSPHSAEGWGPSRGLAHPPASSLPPSLPSSPPGTPTWAAPLTDRSPRPPAPRSAGAHPPLTPLTAAEAPSFSPSPHVESLATCRSRGRRTTPLLRFLPHPTASPHSSAPESPLPSADALRPLGAPETVPPPPR